MDDRSPECYNASFPGLARTFEPARSRWTPKPEQILILESIFNSGMTNPPKDETVRIRKMLEKFGSVGDANVFYWFQNRRSRLRRQQRHAHIINSISDSGGSGAAVNTVGVKSAEYYCSSTTSAGGNAGNISSSSPHTVGGVNHLCSTSPQMALEETMEQSHDAPGFGPFHDHGFLMNSYQQAGHVIVFINEVPTEVPSGPFDMKAMFGEDLMLIHHPSGLPLPCDTHGIILQSLQPGESYFLVPKPT